MLGTLCGLEAAKRLRPLVLRECDLLSMFQGDTTSDWYELSVYIIFDGGLRESKYITSLFTP